MNFARGSGGGFVVIKSSTDLATYLQRQQVNGKLTAGLLSIEGAHALDGKLENLEVLYRAGYRMMSPSHFFDNDIGGSAAGAHKTGLTEKGREWVRQMEARHVIIDLAHAAAQTIEDVLAIASRPLVVSHTGVKGTCDNNRNLSEAWEDAHSPISEGAPFTSEHARIAGSLVGQTRSLGLSLGDRACLALGIATRAPVYTADRSWKNLKLGIGIHVIR